MNKQSTNTILMIRPVAFNYNVQTAVNNHYQNANDFNNNSNQINLRAQAEFIYKVPLYLEFPLGLQSIT